MPKTVIAYLALALIFGLAISIAEAVMMQLRKMAKTVIMTFSLIPMMMVISTMRKA